MNKRHLEEFVQPTAPSKLLKLIINVALSWQRSRLLRRAFFEAQPLSGLSWVDSFKIVGNCGVIPIIGVESLLFAKCAI